MATRISSLNYRDVKNVTKQLRETGRSINTALTNVRQSMSNLRDDWYGDRYNELTIAFDKDVGIMNQLLTITIEQIPDSLDNIASNYSVADNGNKISIAHESITQIQEIGQHQTSEMRFMEGNVRNVQNTVSSKFDTIINLMDNYKQIYAKLNWESEASEQFESTFNSIRNKIIESFNSLKKTFNDMVNYAIEDIGKAESANTVQ